MPLSVATFNVKDLFDPEPNKLANLASLLERLDADVIGLEEIGSEEALDALVRRVPRLGYTSRVVGTPDKRGIRNALLARVPIESARVHTSAALEFPRFGVNDPPPFGARIPLRRGIVHARVAASGLGTVDVLVVHFKSGRPTALLDGADLPIAPVTDRELAEGMLRALVARASEALFVRGIVDGLLASDSRAKVAVTGDMNDVLGSLPLRIVCGTTLASCAAKVADGARYSILYAGARTQIDHVLASAALAERAVDARFLNEDLRDHSVLDASAGPTVDSDHAPLIVRFA